MADAIRNRERDPEAPPPLSRHLGALQAAHHDYRRILDWPTTLDSDTVTLALNREVGGLMISAALAGEVASSLVFAGCAGPVIGIPGSPVRWVFLLRNGTELRPRDGATRPALLLPREASILLPPSNTPTGRVRWIIPPNVVRRLPTTAELLSITRSVLGAHRR